MGKRILWRKEQHLSIGIFTLSIVAFTAYLFLLRYGFSPSPILAWLAILSVIGIIIYQASREITPPKLILAQIFLLSLVAHLISVIPYENGAMNDDFLPYLWTTKLVMEHGFWGLENAIHEFPYNELKFAWAMPIIAKYPVLYSIGIASHKITGIDLATICHWLPSFWSSAGVVAIYLIAKTIYNEERTALFASLGFSTYITFIQLHSQYIRESIAFTLMLFTLWAFLKAFKENSRGVSIVAIVLCAVTVLSHWNVSVMLIGMLVVVAVSFKAESYLVKVRENIPWNLILLATVILMSHWLFVDSYAPILVGNEATGIVQQGTQEGLTFILPEEYETAKSMQVSYTAWAFSICFTLGMLWKIITDFKNKSSQLGLSLATGIWATIIFIVYCVGMGDVTLHPGRTVIFLYPLTMVSIAGLTSEEYDRKVRWSTIALIGLFVVSGIWRSSL